MATRIDDRPAVWMLLIERGLDAGSDVSLFWHERDAIAAARSHLSRSWRPDELATTADVLEAIEAANQLVGQEEYVVLQMVPIAGHQHFEGEADRRPRCRACREPIELEEPGDPGSWVHCEDANYWGDHAADPGPLIE